MPVPNSTIWKKHQITLNTKMKHSVHISIRMLCISWSERKTNKSILDELNIKKRLVTIVSEKITKLLGHVTRDDLKRLIIQEDVEFKVFPATVCGLSVPPCFGPDVYIPILKRIVYRTMFRQDHYGGSTWKVTRLPWHRFWCHWKNIGDGEVVECAIIDSFVVLVFNFAVCFLGNILDVCIMLCTSFHDAGNVCVLFLAYLMVIWFYALNYVLVFLP